MEPKEISEDWFKELELLMLFENMLNDLENPEKFSIFGTLKEEFESKQLLNDLKDDFK